MIGAHQRVECTHERPSQLLPTLEATAPPPPYTTLPLTHRRDKVERHRRDIGRIQPGLRHALLREGLEPRREREGNPQQEEARDERGYPHQRPVAENLLHAVVCGRGRLSVHVTALTNTQADALFATTCTRTPYTLSTSCIASHHAKNLPLHHVGRRHRVWRLVYDGSVDELPAGRLEEPGSARSKTAMRNVPAMRA